MTALTSGQQGGSGEGEAWVLHASVGEGRGQAQHVVASPRVGAGQRLGSSQEVLGLGELECSGLDYRWLGPHLAAVADFSTLEFTGSKGNCSPDAQQIQARYHWWVLYVDHHSIMSCRGIVAQLTQVGGHGHGLSPVTHTLALGLAGVL
jgi:hypothetical protein